MGLSSLIERLVNPFLPLAFLGLSALFGVATFFRLLLALDISSLTSRNRFIDSWFSRFWRFLGPMAAAGDEPHVAPLVAAAYGRVLDLGPGTGLTVKDFDKSKVTKVYGVEPNVGMHAGLRQNIKQAGLADVYEIVQCGAEDLESLIQKESIDCIVCVRVLCGIPEPERLVKTLYGYLKPGGSWLVFEHVQNSKHFVTRQYQGLLQWFWPHFMGGCNINRPTGKMLIASGRWDKVELAAPKGEPSWHSIPHVMGRLIKAGKASGRPKDTVPITSNTKIRSWWDNERSTFVLLYCAISYCFWGFIAAMS